MSDVLKIQKLIKLANDGTNQNESLEAYKKAKELIKKNNLVESDFFSNAIVLSENKKSDNQLECKINIFRGRETMAYREELGGMYHQQQMQPMQQMQHQISNQMMMQPSQTNYDNLPMNQVFTAMGLKDSNEFKTFKRFLEFNSQLNLIEKLANQGAITINQPAVEVVEKKEEKKSFAVAALTILGIIMIGLALV